jgi:septal ring factor EnvC (AmiA/AmiB activator)
MRVYILFLSIITILSSASIDTKISTTKQKLNKSEKEYKYTHSKLNQLGNKLTSETKRLSKISSDIDTLSRKLKNSEKEIREKKKELEDKEVIQKDLVDLQKNLEVKLIEYLARDLSLSFVLKKTGNQDIKSIMQEEIFKNYSKLIKKDTKDLVNKISDNKKIIDRVESDITKLTTYIDNTNKKIARLIKLKEDKKVLIVSLKNQKNDYSKRLKNILSQKTSLAQLLKKLRVTKDETEDEKPITDTKNKATLTKEESNTNIRQIGSSYQRAKTTTYRGKKYNPPLKKYKVVKKFGPYVDPVYKIKIFNNSVVLKSLLTNQKVRSVLAGKVVFAKETPTLKKVVIIKHKDGIHTIYAHLDEIASVIKSGKYVPTGYVVGRNSNELVFEVTKKDRYINPEQFIKLK